MYRHTDLCEGFAKYAVEMGSDAMIYVPNFLKIALVIQKLIGVFTDTQTACSLNLLNFFQNKENRQKMETGLRDILNVFKRRTTELRSLLKVKYFMPNTFL
jgi:hypothetical protein